MKQTNNAIKFLMAQYRAIFRNANLKMFLAAATAAAAMSAGSAQAAGSFDNAALGTTDAGIVEIDGSNLEKIDLSDGSTSNKAFDILLKSNKDDQDANVSVMKGAVSLVNSTITIAGEDAAKAKLSIGKGAKKATAVKLKELTVATKGSLTVEGTSANKTTVTASKISFGDGKTAADSAITIGADSTVIAAGDGVETGVLSINQATVGVSGGGTLTGNNIQITDGAITLGGGVGVGALGTVATDAVPATSSITMESGSITVAKTTSGSITASTITLKGGAFNTTGELTINAGTKFSAQGGTVDVKKDGGDSGSLIIAGAADFGAKSKIVNSGSITLKGATTIESESIEVADDSILKIDGTDPTASLTVSAAALEKFKKGAIHAESGQEATIIFKDAEVDLGKDELVLKSTGDMDDTKYVDNGGTFKFKGTKATFTSGSDFNNAATFEFGTMSLGADGDLKIDGGAKLNIGSSLAVNGTAESATGLTVSSGSITLDGASGSITAKDVILKGTSAAGEATLNVNSGVWGVKDLTLTQGNAVVSGSTLNVDGKLTVTNGSVSVKDGSTLNIKGDLATTAKNGFISGNASVINTIGGGAVALKEAGVQLDNTASLKLESKDFEKEENGKKVFDPSKLTGAITGSTNTTITIMNGDSKLSMTETEFTALQTALGADKFKGSIDVDVTGTIENAKDGMNLSDVKDGLGADAYKNISAKQEAGTAVSGNKTIGSVELTGTGDTLQLDGAKGATLTLYTAKDGKFVYKTADGTTTTAGVSFAGKDNSLTLVGSGEIGAIKNASTTAVVGALTVGTAEKAGTVTVKGGIGEEAQNKGVESVTVNAQSHLNVDGGVYTNNLDMRKGTSLNAKDGSGDVVVTKTATIMGDVNANALKLDMQSGVHTIAGNSEINVNTLSLGKSGSLTIGTDGKDSTSASVFTDVLFLGANSALYVDPAYGQAASIVVADRLDASKDKQDVDAGTISGDVFVGMNAAVGIGFTKDEFKTAMADYLTYNGGFSNADGAVKNAFVLDKKITVDSGKKIVVDPSKTLDELKKQGSPNSLTMAAGSALIVSDDAVTGTDAAITFGAAASVDAAEGSKVVLVGDFNNGSSINLFGATGGNQVSLTNEIKLSAAGGLLEATIGKGAYSTPTALNTVVGFENIARAGVSSSVGQIFIDYVDGNLNFVKDSVGHEFLIDSMQSAEGRKQFDAAAHAATYAGAQQAAVAAVGTMAGAVGGRVGSMGVEATAITATGSQANGGVWLAPMYQSVDADGFNAEGASYGADVDLGGVAFGADTVNGNMRFGAVFNIGSGDADGKGNGAGLKDEFDYYGFGIYSVMGFGQLAIVGDASLNVISHEVEGLEAKGEADTTAVTMGVTGQYTISNPMVDVTPHLGARFIRLDTDSYDLTVGGKTLATTDFDVQNVFSIPLGVTLSKAFEMGGWSLAPSADLTITFNTGDTEAKSTTRFDGIQRDIGLSTEVLDEVTYGVAVGLGAQYGAFGTQIGINYTGSENTDSFGVNANARYMF